MKILIITNHSYMFWQFRRELTAALLKDHQVVLSTPFVGHQEDLEAMGCRCIETAVDRRGINPATDLKLFSVYRRLIRQERPDLVVTYSIKPNIYGGLASRLAGVPYCANVQGLGTAFQRKGLAALVTAMYRAALGKARRVFFENEGNAALFREKKIVPAQRQTVLPGAGVDLACYTPEPRPEDGQVRFLFVGRIMREKGVDELFWAARRLKEEYGEGVAFDVVGFFEDAYRQTVEELAAEHILTFHGFQQDVRPFYAAADCVVLPSYHEGMSNVLLEGAASGRALVTSDIPGCREAVEDGVTGFLCPAGDREALLDRLRRFASCPPEKRTAMGRAGRALMERRFRKEDVVARTLAALLEDDPC